MAMPKTEKLYWQDAMALDFEGRVVATTTFGDRPALVLDRTAFYPESGGQLGDHGTLTANGISIAVDDVQIDDAGVIHHLVSAEAAGAVAAGATVRGQVEQARRRDHMSQHTGQHMLSRALVDEVRGETVSARLGASICTVDIALPSLADAAVARVEDLVNAVVLENRPIRSLFPTPEELARLPLRREPKVAVEVRVIEIDGFDLSPCGGTHCASTGQVGPVSVTGVERYKGLTRVSFLCGTRALRDYSDKNAALAELARSFTCAPLDVGGAVAKLRAELKQRGDTLDATRGELAALLAAQSLAATPPNPVGTTRVVIARAGDDLATLRAIARRIAARPDAVALCASREAGSGDWLVVIERGASATFDAGAFLKAAAIHGGRGGGRTEHAEGRLPCTADWEVLARGE